LDIWWKGKWVVERGVEWVPTWDAKKETNLDE
jgi:hypothetical protein